MNNGDCFTRDERLLVMSTEEELLKESTPDDHCHLWMYFRKPINDYEISMYESVPRSVHKRNIYKRVQLQKLTKTHIFFLFTNSFFRFKNARRRRQEEIDRY